MSTGSVETTCCVVGGGPAGIMLGYLLARAGVSVTVLEKHKDFFRDFRGDTVHPSTLQVFHELGLLDELLQLPHQQLTSIGGVFGDFSFRAADLRHVPSQAKFVALMPQWDFLNFVVEQAQKFPSFNLRMGHEAVDLVWEDGRVAGVASRIDGESMLTIRADLVVGCDGRHSTVRRAAGLEVMEFGVPIDVLWFRISRQPEDPEQLFGNVNFGKILVLINRGEYSQAGLIIRKGSFEEIKARGLREFRKSIAEIAPYLGGRVSELQDWEQIKLLTVRINRLRLWYREGLLCIGDAAHAMSPAGGVGINLAIQDAVAAARLLARPLLAKRVTEAVLASVHKRREFPARVTQFVQVKVHNQMGRIFENPGPAKAPWQLKIALQVPGVQHLIGRVVGIGVRPEHIESPAGKAGCVRGPRLRTVVIFGGLAAAVAFVAVRQIFLPKSSKNSGQAGLKLLICN